MLKKVLTLCVGGVRWGGERGGGRLGGGGGAGGGGRRQEQQQRRRPLVGGCGRGQHGASITCALHWAGNWLAPPKRQTPL